MRAVIVGAGEVGSSIAASLVDSHDVVVVDIDPDRVETLTYDLDVLAIEGDGTSREVLREAGAGDADLLIASTDDDETNIVTCGTAETCCEAFTIARVKRPQYLETWQSARGAFGVDFMVCTDLLTAQNVVGLIGFATAQDVDTFADGLVRMTELEIPEGSPVAGQTVQETDRFDSMTFAAIIRGEDVIIPRGDTRIEADDDIIVIGSQESTAAFSTAVAPDVDDAREIVIIGGGEIGYQTARLLEGQGYSPRLVERDADRARWLAEQLPETTVLEHDGTDRGFLQRENVGLADVVVSALENDQQNLLATLLAKRLGADRAIAIVDTPTFTDLFEAVGVDVAVSPRQVTAEEITRFTRARRAENVSLIEGDRAEVMEVEIDADSQFAGRTISETATGMPRGVVIGAITRGNELVTPRGDTVVEAGDHVVLFAETGAVDAVTKLL